MKKLIFKNIWSFFVGSNQISHRRVNEGRDGCPNKDFEDEEEINKRNVEQESRWQSTHAIRLETKKPWNEELTIEQKADKVKMTQVTLSP